MVKQSSQKRESASSMAEKIREISISEFFAKNRHLLGFDHPLKAVLTTVREGVDNSLDACEEGGILPEILVQVEQLSESTFRVLIEDNGPGILKSHLPNIFGKLLYGSKFHRLKQSRGQQGIGISAAVMYGQMTTGKPAEVISKIGKGKPAQKITLQIDTKKNTPKVLSDTISKEKRWEEKESGTSISITMEGAYKEGRHGALAYISQTALANPHASFTLVTPKGQTHHFPRIVQELPESPKEIKPHPHGVELGTLIQFLNEAKSKPVSQFLQTQFCRVSEQAAKDICKAAKINQSLTAALTGRTEAEALYKAIQDAKLLPPPTNCLSPMGEESILKALYWLFVESKKWEIAEGDEEGAPQLVVAEPKADLKKSTKTKAPKKGQVEFAFDAPKEDGEVPKEPLQTLQNLRTDEEGSLLTEDYFVTAITRPPNVYRGNPFQVEVGIFYGKDLKSDSLAQVYRYANRVPLQYQASACASGKAVMSVPWKSYGLQQSKGALPLGPVVIMVHIASVWVPYTSESKEAIAHYPEILKEMRLALMECGRRLQRYLKRKWREADEAQKRGYIEKYLDPIGEALQEILSLNAGQRQETVENLKTILERTRSKKEPEKKAA